MESEKRQYAGWNHSGNSLQHPFQHGGNYNNNYLSNTINVTTGSSGGYLRKQKQSAVPISICVMILICYLTCGAALFHELQKWGVLESIYFCFTALSTIGFGDLQPRDELGMYVASAYIIIGMAIVAMCFSLIQTELIIWLRKFSIHHHSATHEDEITLTNIAITPIKSWHRPNDLLLTDYNSLPRTPRGSTTGFNRNTPARRSAGILESQMEYFVPRSVSEFNLSGVGDLALALPPPPKRIQQTIVPITPMTQTTIMSIQKPREKMVTFEDESTLQKCPHGVPATPSRKAQPMMGDVFMWREGGDENIENGCDAVDYSDDSMIKVWERF
jgi:Ion channel